MKKYNIDKRINGIDFKLNLDLRPHVIALSVIEVAILIEIIRLIIK